MSEVVRVHSVSELDELLEASKEAPVLLFKHSLTCPISAAAFREYESFVGSRAADDAAVFRLVEVQKARELSNEIASRSGVRHESPQALLLRGGKVVWHASHWSIKASALQEALAS